MIKNIYYHTSEKCKKIIKIRWFFNVRVRVDAIFFLIRYGEHYTSLFIYNNFLSLLRAREGQSRLTFYAITIYVNSICNITSNPCVCLLRARAVFLRLVQTINTS